MAIRIVGDSCCDLSQEYVRQHPCFSMMPLSYRIGDTEYIDTPETGLDYKTFYKRLREGDISKTSQATPQAICDNFTPILENGDDLIYITLSSGLSSGYANSLTAKADLEERFPERRIHIVDSRLATLGIALVITPLVEMAENGRGFDEIASHADSLVPQTLAWFTVDDLPYLKRGGRLSPTSAFFGSLLNIKPAMFMDNHGRLVVVEKCKGRKRVLKVLLNKMGELGAELAGQDIAISHSDCEDEARAFAQEIKDTHHVNSVMIEPIGPVIGSHTGANTIALFFRGKQREKEGITPISES